MSHTSAPGLTQGAAGNAQGGADADRDAGAAPAPAPADAITTSRVCRLTCDQAEHAWPA